MFGFFKKQKQQNKKQADYESEKCKTSQINTEAEEMIDDISFIKELKHIRGVWQQYDVLLAARGYGWEYMVDWAAYMEKEDLDNISTVTVAEIANMPAKELIDEYRKTDGGLKDFDLLSHERGVLSIGGISRTLGCPVKIVWFNQTRVLRFFTLIDDEVLITKYIETVIRRTFGTKDAMKLANPVPDNEQ